MPTLNQVYFDSLKKITNPNEEINIRILLCYINGLKNMNEFYIKKDENIKDLQGFLSYFARFLDGEPIQYILKETEFFGHKFYVDNRVLIPRQESEELVQNFILKINHYFKGKSVDVLDCCCGSGCLGLSLANNVETNTLVLSDISSEALEVAKINSNSLFPTAKLIKSDSLTSIKNAGLKFDILISNPPYIFDKNYVDENVNKYEPHLALYCSPDLEVYENIFKDIQIIKKETLLCGFEIGDDCVPKLKELINKYLPEAEYEFIKDINNKYRMLFIIIR